MKGLKAILSAFDRNDIPQMLVIVGCLLLGYGFSRLHDGLGMVAVGLILILYVRPLRGWWTR